MLLAAFVVIDYVVAVVVEDDAVLQHLSNRGTLCAYGSSCSTDGTLGIGSYAAAGEEVTAGTKAKLGRTERILDRAVRARLRHEAN